MTVKEREQRQILRKYKKKYGSKDVVDAINCVEELISETRRGVEDLETDLWKLENERDALNDVKSATCVIEKPMAKHTARPTTERKLSTFFGE